MFGALVPADGADELEDEVEDTVVHEPRINSPPTAMMAELRRRTVETVRPPVHELGSRTVSDP